LISSSLKWLGEALRDQKTKCDGVNNPNSRNAILVHFLALDLSVGGVGSNMSEMYVLGQVSVYFSGLDNILIGLAQFS
jgi:hypothetical protein